jgi:hypothetical protein
MNDNVNAYINLIEAYFVAPSELTEDAIEAFEAANPELVDAIFDAAGALAYEIVSGTVTNA